MRKLMFFLLGGAAVLLLMFAYSFTPADTKAVSYGEDRALIEDLQARYMFALDFGDVDTYRKSAPSSKDAQNLRPATGRHNITNIVIAVDGDKATGRAYWFHYGNNNPERKATFDSYGHYEDEMVKVNGKWLFSKRRIYNEQVDKWAAPQGRNPAW